MEFEIITDSAANLSEEFIEREKIEVLSLSFFIEGKEYYGYERGKHVDLSKFYEMMRAKKDVRTSLVNIEAARSLGEMILKQGKDIIYIGFSSGLSGTYQSVFYALEDLKMIYPERKIYMIDSLSAALGEGLLVYHAARMRKNGCTLEEVYQWVQENKLKVCHWFTVEDLFFLRRGGRISGKNAVLGVALQVKPVLYMNDDGELKLAEKVRGRKKSLDCLVEKFIENAIEPEKYPLFINHGDCPKDAEYVKNKITERCPIKEIFVRVLDPVMGAHAGPGTVALFFLGEYR